MKEQHSIYRNFILFIFIFWASLLNAQQYPVQVTPVLTPPYSLRLADYATTSENKLQVQLLMKDLMEPAHRIKIHFSLESGVSSTTILQNTPVVSGFQEITLYPGTPVLLSNIDLRALFKLENLTGINAANYANPLPEGLYKFCFQVFDAITGRALSAKSPAVAYLVQYEPPMLNLPQNGEKVLKTNEFQNIVFQWMPRQMAPNTRYIFTLKELWDTQRDPISGFLSSRVLWQEETYAPTLYYGIDKTALIPGKRYAWQVQSKSGNPVFGNSPTEDNGVYKNNGLSEIFYFDYTENCLVPIMLSAKNIGRGKTEIRWSMTGNSFGNLYRIQYRRKGSTTEWSQQESYQDMCVLTGLKDETEYEYRVGTVCGNLYDGGNATDNAYAFSNVQEFKTSSKEAANNNIQCGILPQVDISNKSPLQTALGTNEVFMAGDFAVTVLQSQGTSGTYSGYGYIEVSYLADTKIKVTFNNIKLNTDKQLIEGILETTYDVNESSLTHLSQGIGELFGDKGVQTLIVDYVVSDIEYIATPPPGKIIITGNSGAGNNNDIGSGEASKQELPAGKDYTITDKDGNVWHVDEEGKVTKGEKVAEGGASTSENTEGISGSGSNAKVDQYTAKGVRVEWKEISDTKYAYDSADKLPELKDKYPTVKDSDGNTVYVSYKAVVNGSEDAFGAKIIFDDEELKERKVIFKTLKIGQEIPAQKGSDNNYTLKLKGTMNYAEEDVVAVLMPKDSTEKQQIIGSFKLVHLEPKTINVVLVPTDEVSKAKLDSIEKETNAIYSKVGVTINFEKDDIFDITPYLDNQATISTEKNSLSSTYSKVQQAINKAYSKQNDNRYILFVTDRKSSTGQMGYMRLGGQFGYIFNSPTGKTVAHELGHGVFQLEHPWDKYKTSEKATNLLMDYSGGTSLFHLDWEQINDPALKFHFFQGQEEGEFGKGYAISPNYKIFAVGTSTAMTESTKANYESYPERINDGTLPGFVLNGNHYFWDYESNEGGYIFEKTDSVKISYALDTLSRNDLDENKWIYLFFEKDNGCGSSSYSVVSAKDLKSFKGSLTDFISQNSADRKLLPCTRVETVDSLNPFGKEVYDANSSKVPEDSKDILLNIAHIAQDLPRDVYQSFIDKQKHDGAPFWRSENQGGEYNRENLESSLRSINNYKKAFEKLNTHNFVDCDEFIEFIRANFQITKGSSFPIFTDPRFVRLQKDPFAHLPLNQKKKLIDLLHNCEYAGLAQNIGDDVDAGTVLAVIFDVTNSNSAKGSAEAKDLIDYIVEKNYIKRFVDDLYGNSYNLFINALFNLTLKSYTYNASIVESGKEIKALTFDPSYFQLNSENIDAQSNITLRVKQWFGKDYSKVQGKPYDGVVVSFKKDVDFGTQLKFKAGERVVLPMIWAYELFWKDTKAARWKTAQITVEVGLTALGVGEVMMAVRAYRTAQTARATFLAIKAVSDMGVGFTDIYVNNSDALSEEQLQKWNTFVLLYSVGSFSTSVGDGLIQKYGKKTISSSDDFTKFEEALQSEKIDLDETLARSPHRAEIEETLGKVDEISNISKNTVKLVDQLDLGKFITKIGDYEVYEKGEIFYRAISKEHYDELIKTGRMRGGTETFTSPTLKYIQAVGYDREGGVILKFLMKKGTHDKLLKIGIRNDDSTHMLELYKDLPKGYSGWKSSKALFKTEGEKYVKQRKLDKVQINIGLGDGDALNIFNENIIQFQIIK